MTSLRVFRDPASVAVVGASDDPAKWGHWLARGALSGSARRAVYLVNTNADTVLGQPVHGSLRDLPEVPELVVVAVPAARDVVAEAVELGVRGLIGITAGVQFERQPGIRILGPNCLGVYDSATDLRLAWGTFTPGPLGIVSQSGQIGLEIAELAASYGVGVSRFVSVGNQVDVTIDEVLDDLASHEPTRLIALYAEDFGDGRALVRTIARLREAGKPTIVLTVGGSDASRAAARSHTGALTTSLDIVDAACRAAGAVRVRTPGEVAALAQVLSHMDITGERLAILTDSGGQGAIAADLAAGLCVRPLSPELAAQVGQWLPEQGSARNPIDLAGAGEQDLDVYGRITRLLATEFDTVLITSYLGCYGRDTPTLRDRELDVVASLSGNIVVHTMAESGAAVDALREKGIPVFRDVGSALTALDGGARSARALPRKIPEIAGTPGRVASGYLAARELLKSAGITFPRWAEVEDMGRLKAPYVLKADWITHKSEAGAVVLGLADEAAVVQAHVDMVARLGEGRYLVEEMDTRPGAVEMIIGARRDPAFGPIVMVGAGGVRAELDKDTTLELAPVEPWHALEMLRRLRCAPLLDGWRGRSPVDIPGLVDVIVAVSRVIAARPDITDLELNPVRVTADGPIAVDALVR
jgi:acyl-CoA synthetase (NDP forming)